MENIKIYKKQFISLLFINTIIGSNISLASYIHLPINGFKDFFAYALHFLALQATVFGFTYVFSLHRLLYLIIFPLIYLILSSISFWVFTQDVSLTPGVMQAVLETKPDIVVDLISLPLILHFIWSLFCVIICVNLFKRIIISSLKSPLLVVAIICIGLFYLGENIKFGIFKRRLPYSAITATNGYLKKPNTSFNKNIPQVSKRKDSLHVVLVLGETVRADHLQLNNYPRETTPLLSRSSNLMSFPNIYTPLTYTAVSLPQILTDASIKNKQKDPATILYSILNRLDIHTTWLGNQSIETSYKNIVYENSDVLLIDQFHSVLSFKKLKDEELLKSFEALSQQETSSFTTLHMIGSHWFYDSRYPEKFKKFTPTATSKFLKSSTKEELINSYDNTILYLDWFLYNLIQKVEKQDKSSLVIYLSDHGEVLGEDNKWFHAQNHPAAQNPAMLLWYSKNFKKKYPELIANLKKKQFKRIPTDFLFHSILDLYQVKNFKYDIEESIFN